MQEIRHDGSEFLSEIPTIDYEKRLRAAIEDKRNASVAIHKPGSVFKSKGAWFYVDPVEGLRRVSWWTGMKLRKTASK